MKTTFKTAVVFFFPLLRGLTNAQNWGRNCPFDETTWTHAETNAMLTVTKHCIEGGRCYFLHVPDCSATAVTDPPLVMVLHGRTGCPFEVDDSTRWGLLAETECFVTVYPEGNINFDDVGESCWAQNGGIVSDTSLFLGINKRTPPCCCTTDYAIVGNALPLPERRLRDANFIRSVARDVTTRITIDTKRIYLGGHSNGCLMAASMAMTNSDMVAGVACHSSLLITPPSGSYDAVPFFMAHGMLDGDFPYEPSDITGLGIYSTLGKEGELKYLGDLNECDETVVVDETTETFAAEAKLLKRVNCKNNAEVQLLAVFTAGHFPMKGEFRGDLEDNPNIQEVTIDTTKIAWDFIKQYSRTQAPDLSADAGVQIIPSSGFTLVLTGLASVGGFIQNLLPS